MTKGDSNDFTEALRSLDVGERIRFPDGRQASLRRIEPMFSQSARADLCVIETEDGQTLAIKRVTRSSKTVNVVQKALTSPKVETILRVGVKVFASDLPKAREFYVNKLRLPINRLGWRTIELDIITHHRRLAHLSPLFRNAHRRQT